MYHIGDYVQIVNHVEPECNNQFGTIEAVQLGYDGHTRFYTVILDDSMAVCTCIDDELMEG